ncbi:MAG: hypothetical protein ACRDZW_11120 [Acidimicrobiales bacterium]
MRRTLLVLVMTAAVMAGCGGGDSGDKLLQLLAAAPDKSVAKGTSKVAIGVDVTGSVSTSYTIEGEFDFKQERGRFSLDLSKLGFPEGGPSEVRFSGSSAFMQLQEKEWLKVDLGVLGRSSGINKPTAQLYYLKGVTGEVRKLGTEAVRGEPTTRYAAPVDLDRTARAVSPKLRDEIRQTIRQLGTSDLATEAWLDGAGRLRQLRYTIDLSTLSSTSASPPRGKVAATYEFFDFGVGVEVADPPAAQVVDLAAIPSPTAKKK